MKDIERLFKEALDQHELPFESGAWEAMSKRLDGTPSTPFYRKWWFAASVGTILVSSATYFLLQENADQPQKTLAHTEETISSATNTTTNPTNTNKNTSTSILNKVENSSNYTSESNPSENDHSLQVEQKIEHKEQKTLKNSDEINKTTTPSEEPKQQVSAIESYQTLSLKTQVCLNEELQISNPNDKELIFVKHLNGTLTGIKPGGKVTVNTDTEGTILVSSGNHTDEIHVVKANSKLYIDVDSYVIYDDGIPTLKFKVSGNQQAVSWSSNVKATEVAENTYTVHPYTDKSVNVTVESKDLNGCPIEERTSVKIDEPYNLMAPTGFYPLDFDIRKNRFIPYALTKRSVSFELYIYDPKNAGVVFKTQDASLPWDGIDVRTGEMVPEGTSWPWKVILKNPNPGEPKEYSGTITRL